VEDKNVHAVLFMCFCVLCSAFIYDFDAWFDVMLFYVYICIVGLTLLHVDLLSMYIYTDSKFKKKKFKKFTYLLTTTNMKST
jgi:hypothetical protein